MADQDTPSARADRRARIIAGQALREAASPATGRRGGRRRNHGPIWTTPAPVVLAQPQGAGGASDGTVTASGTGDEKVAVSAEVGDDDKTTPVAGLSRGTPAKKDWRS